MFKPWDDFKECCPIIIDVKEPPCKRCKYWSPRIKTDSIGDYGGVRLCINTNMYPDFSCFEERDGK